MKSDVFSCMAEGPDSCCYEVATHFTVFGSRFVVLLCWCDEHNDRRTIAGEREISREEWEALQALEEVYDA